MLKRGVIWVGMVVVIGVMFYGLTPMIAAQDSMYRTYAPLIEVDALVRREYMRPTRSRALVDGAIRGMLRALDPYSGYVAPHEMQAFRRRTTGRYVGVGVELGAVGGRAVVIAPMESGPAFEAGVRGGDVIHAVDGRSCEDLSVFEVEGLLVGEPDTTVRLVIQRGDERIVLAVNRAAVQRRSVGGFAIDGTGGWSHIVDAAHGIGYVRVSRFSEGMVEELDRVLDDLRLVGVRGLIIDLRFNPGGLVGQAVSMADRFLSDGVIVRTVNRWGAVRTFTAGGEQVLEGAELAILVNGASASASEIVAGALQDHGRAVLVGERTFGKGSVQDFIRIQNGEAGLCLTVAHYQLPGGRMIHKDDGAAVEGDWGVVPDVLVPIGDGERAAILERRMELERLAAGGGMEESAESTASRHLLMDSQLRAAVEALHR